MKLSAVDGGQAKLGRNLAASTPSVPIPPPGLLERAKQLGAISAGPSALLTGPSAVGKRTKKKAAAPRRKAKKRK